MGAFVIILSHLSTCSSPWVLIQKNKKSWFQCSKTKGTKTFQDYNTNNIVSKQPTFLETVVILLHQLHPSPKKTQKSHNIVGTRLVGFPSWSPSSGVVLFLVHLLRSKPTTVTDPWHHEDLCWLVILWNGILISWAYEIMITAHVVLLVYQARGDFVGSSGEFTWESYSLKVQGKHETNKHWKHDLYPNRIFPRKPTCPLKSLPITIFSGDMLFFEGSGSSFCQKTSKKQPGHKLRHMFKRAHGHKFYWLTAFSHPIIHVLYQKT